MQNIKRIFQIYPLTNIIHLINVARTKFQRYFSTNYLMVGPSLHLQMMFVCHSYTCIEDDCGFTYIYK